MPDQNKMNAACGNYLIFRGLLVMVFATLSSCTDKTTTQLDRIKARGEIVVVTRNGPTSYYIEKNSETGLEYVLAKKFAAHLGVELKTVIAKNSNDVTKILNSEQADFAAAALIHHQSRGGPLVFGPAYLWVTQQLVYRNGLRPPSSLEDIFPDKLDLALDTSTLLPLDQLQQEAPSLSWNIHTERDSHEMLELLENKEILYTITDSNELTLARQYYPEIRVAFNVSSPQPVAWAFRNHEDRSLLQAVWRFHEEISRSGELIALINQYFVPVGKFDYVDARKFIDRFQVRLPPLQSLFEEVAGEQEMDWRLLAAISYQESHWHEQAVSTTGEVKGLMMLKQDTAESVGVNNRFDPEQSIRGGTIYLKSLIGKIPERIPEPDRTWMAVAAYNVGYGHLEDARVLTQKQGGDPDIWLEVKQRLPLLSRKEWFNQTKFGYARGVEPVLYVERIKKYYNTLVQLTQPEVPSAELTAGQLVETRISEDPLSQ
ncbi:MAG: rane-bound lytic murein transglycosylase F [Gammaproteobacteria bacterium]|nr:rane-bound lytic murein transglycosylase F [Gammaproteobacteria bacterium]